MEASAKDRAHNRSGGTNLMRAWYEVMRCERDVRGRHMAEDNRRKGGRRRDMMGLLLARD
jgi:hypothetical protein